MHYVSTRGHAPTLDFGDVLLTGLAADGGLYLPESWPALPPVSSSMSYPEVATLVMEPFVAQRESRERAKAEELAPYIEAALARKPWMQPLADEDIPVVRASVKKVEVNREVSRSST